VEYIVSDADLLYSVNLAGSFLTNQERGANMRRVFALLWLLFGSQGLYADEKVPVSIGNVYGVQKKTIPVTLVAPVRNRSEELDSPFRITTPGRRPKLYDTECLLTPGTLFRVDAVEVDRIVVSLLATSEYITFERIIQCERDIHKGIVLRKDDLPALFQEGALSLKQAK
jgi:hypothetical protein